MGRCLVATRDIEPLAVILTDSPAAIGTHVEGREVHTAKRLLKGETVDPISARLDLQYLKSWE